MGHTVGCVFVPLGLYVTTCRLNDTTTVTYNDTLFDNPEWPPTNVIDGNSGSCAAFVRPSWVQLNLPEIHHVERIRVLGRTDTGEVLLSMDGTTVTYNGTLYDNPTWPLANVIDGYSGSCAAILRPTWVQLNLPEIHLVERIRVLGRTDAGFNQFGALKLSAGNNNESMADFDFQSIDITLKQVLFSPPLAIQTIRVSGLPFNMAENNYMTICEIEVYRQNDCPVGRYGTSCFKECQCLHGSCESITGRCAREGCLDGWRVDSCSAPCETRRYGSNCSMDCHCTVCHHVDGSCAHFGHTCDVGFSTNNGQCKICANRQYGLNCTLDCHCDKCHNINGSCTIYQQVCHNGFQMEGELCKLQSCPDKQRIEEEHKCQSEAELVSPWLIATVSVSLAFGILLLVNIVLAVAYVKRSKFRTADTETNAPEA